MAMSSSPRPLRSGYAVDWVAEPPIVQPAHRKRTSGSFARHLIMFGIGIAATLAWQSYGDIAREFLSQRYPQLAWLAPPPPPALPTSVRNVASTTAADLQELRTISLSLAAVRQKVDQLAASQDQAARDVATQLQQSRQEILDKISVLSLPPANPPARKPAPTAPSR